MSSTRMGNPWQRDIEAFGHSLRVRVEHPELVDTVKGFVAGFASGRGAPACRYHFNDRQPATLWRDDVVLYESAHPMDLVAVFELDLYRRVFYLAGRQALLLHAALLSRPQGALLLAGSSGSGKSSLALALLTRGARYLGDEHVCVTPQHLAHGLPRPISFCQGELPEELPAGYRVLDYPVRTVSGVTQLSRLVQVAEQHIEHRAIPLRALVVLSAAHGGPVQLQALSPGQALRALWPEVLEPGEDALQHLGDLLEQAPAFELRGGDVDSSANAIQQLWNSPS